MSAHGSAQIAALFFQMACPMNAPMGSRVALTSLSEIRRKQMLSREERQKIMDENPPEVSCVHYANVYFDWDWKGCGFGQLSFGLDSEKMELTAMNECMSRNSVRKLLHAFADYIADRVVLDNPADVPPINFKAEREQYLKDAEAWIAESKVNRRKGQKDGNN